MNFSSPRPKKKIPYTVPKTPHGRDLERAEMQLNACRTQLSLATTNLAHYDAAIKVDYDVLTDYGNHIGKKLEQKTLQVKKENTEYIASHQRIHDETIRKAGIELAKRTSQGNNAVMTQSRKFKEEHDGLYKKAQDSFYYKQHDIQDEFNIKGDRDQHVELVTVLRSEERHFVKAANDKRRGFASAKKYHLGSKAHAASPASEEGSLLFPNQDKENAPPSAAAAAHRVTTLAEGTTDDDRDGSVGNARAQDPGGSFFSSGGRHATFAGVDPPQVRFSALPLVDGTGTGSDAGAHSSYGSTTTKASAPSTAPRARAPVNLAASRGSTTANATLPSTAPRARARIDLTVDTDLLSLGESAASNTPTPPVAPRNSLSNNTVPLSPSGSASSSFSFSSKKPLSPLALKVKKGVKKGVKKMRSALKPKRAKYANLTLAELQLKITEALDISAYASEIANDQGINLPVLNDILVELIAGGINDSPAFKELTHDRSTLTPSQWKFKWLWDHCGCSTELKKFDPKLKRTTGEKRMYFALMFDFVINVSFGEMEKNKINTNAKDKMHAEQVAAWNAEHTDGRIFNPRRVALAAGVLA